MKNLVLAKNAPDLVQALSTYGYGLYPSRIPNLSAEKLQPLIDTFIELTNLPLEDRRQWEIDADGDGDADDGLIERKGSLYDQKFFFHFKSMHRILAAMSGKESFERDRKKWMYFLTCLSSIHGGLSQDMHDIVTTFDDMHPYNLERKVVKQGRATRGVLRLLYYKPGHSVVAKPHYDRSLLTFHVADSHPGLIVGEENEKIKSIYVPKNDNTVLAFPGIKAELVTDGFLHAARHCAVADEVTIKQGRWSIVFFYHCDAGILSSEIDQLVKIKTEA